MVLWTRADFEIKFIISNISWPRGAKGSSALPQVTLQPTCLQLSLEASLNLQAVVANSLRLQGGRRECML